MGYNTREEIIDLFYQSETVKLSKDADKKEALVGSVLAKAIYVDIEGDTRQMYRAGEKIHLHDIDEMLLHGVKTITRIDNTHKDSLHSHIILSCFERGRRKVYKQYRRRAFT